ncbi:hypothetical protein C8J57DRAFT_1257695 [Mycena rebaudengoi]|nr:hypothetical protein C8J57DRAFT_1257695 [Mycena rebaudengoi]
MSMIHEAVRKNIEIRAALCAVKGGERHDVYESMRQTHFCVFEKIKTDEKLKKMKGKVATISYRLWHIIGTYYIGEESMRFQRVELVMRGAFDYSIIDGSRLQGCGVGVGDFRRAEEHGNRIQTWRITRWSDTESKRVDATLDCGYNSAWSCEMTSREAPSSAVSEARGSDGAGGMGTAGEKFVGVRRRAVSFPAGSIRNDGVNREVNAHQASEVWSKDVGIRRGLTHLSIKLCHISADQRADPADLGQYGSAKEV